MLTAVCLAVQFEAALRGSPFQDLGQFLAIVAAPPSTGLVTIPQALETKAADDYGLARRGQSLLCAFR